LVALSGESWNPVSCVFSSEPSGETTLDPSLRWGDPKIFYLATNIVEAGTKKALPAAEPFQFQKACAFIGFCTA
jgi:hypothetical protein